MAPRPAQRLLVVDDDPIVRESLAPMLSRAFEVETAAGVGDARRSVSGAHFDAIFCDLTMDDGGGEAAARAPRRRHARGLRDRRRGAVPG